MIDMVTNNRDDEIERFISDLALNAFIMPFLRVESVVRAKGDNSLGFSGPLS